MGTQPANDVFDVVDDEHDATQPQDVGGALGSAVLAVGVWSFISSSRLRPSAVRTLAMSTRSPRPDGAVRRRPSTACSPSTSVQAAR